MTNDDDRIAYLAGEDGVDVDDATRADLDELRSLLGRRRRLWAVAARRPRGLDRRRHRPRRPQEHPAPPTGAPRPTPPPPPPAGGTVTSLASHRARRIRTYVTAAAAVVVLAVGGVFVATRDRSSNDGTAVALEAGPLGTRRQRHRPRQALPRRGGGSCSTPPGCRDSTTAQFYEAWLKDADGVLVPIGTFNEGVDVVLWAGVSPEAVLHADRHQGDRTTATRNRRSSVVLSVTITLDDAATS